MKRSYVKPYQTMPGDFYRQQLIRLKKAVPEKPSEYGGKAESIILRHNNAKLHIAVRIKNYLEKSGWEILAD